MPIAEAIIPLGLFLCVFGVFYIYFTTRHRERMALIDKEMDANLLRPDSEAMADMRKRILLNLALCLIGIGLGIACAIILYSVFRIEAVYPASIFIFAGLGLLMSIMIQRKWSEEYE